MKRPARKWLMPLIASLALALALATDAFAKPRESAPHQPGQSQKSPRTTATAPTKTREEAARQAARQYDAAKVLSVKTVRQGNRQVHVVKLLTRDGVVKTVRVPADGR
jgi:uncharacterized membrane protein YkoI